MSRRLWHRPAATARRVSPSLSRPARLRVESLEDRCLLNVTSIFANASDMVLYRPNSSGFGDSAWWITTQATGFSDAHSRIIGKQGDIPVHYSDFDGDGSADMVLWRPSNGNWYVVTSGSNFDTSNPIVQHWGTNGDIPIENVDFDGDGQTDFVVYRPDSDYMGNSAFFVWGSGSYYYTTRIIGQAGDIPVQNCDFDGDGRTDLALWRPGNGTWYVLTSSSNYTTLITQQWGTAGDIPLGNIDFDGDGQTDFVVYRPNSDGLGNSAFFVWGSGGYYYTTRIFGQVGDVPVQYSDFDGDGRTDLALWRPGTNEWTVLMSGTGYDMGTLLTQTVGVPGDVPIPNSDFDGDGVADMTLWRDTGYYSYWVVYMSSSGFTDSFAVQWGTTGDIPVPMNFSPPGCCHAESGHHGHRLTHAAGTPGRDVVLPEFGMSPLPSFGSAPEEERATAPTNTPADRLSDSRATTLQTISPIYGTIEILADRRMGCEGAVGSFEGLEDIPDPLPASWGPAAIGS